MLEESLSSSPTFWAALYSWFTPTVFFLLLQLVIATIYITSTIANATHKHQQPHQQDLHQAQNFPQPHHHQQLFRSPSVLQRLKSINFYSYPYRSQQEPLTQQLQTYENETPQLVRSPSVLQRLKSINLLNFQFPIHQPFTSKLTPDNNNDNNVFTHEKRHVAVKEKHQKQQEEDNEEEEDDDVLGHIRDNLGGNEEDNISLDEVYMKLQAQGGNFARTHSDTKPDSGEVPVKLSRKMKKSASNKSAFSHFKEEDIVESLRPATVKEVKVAAMDEDELVDAKADDFINKFKHQLKLQRIDSIMRYKDTINKGTSK